MGEPEVERFLSSLAVEGNVAASTQYQSLSALLFLYKVVFERPLGERQPGGHDGAQVGESESDRRETLGMNGR